ncbi:MAG: phosphopantetheine-binding protein [Bdellovibrionota bacterium]
MKRNAFDSREAVAARVQQLISSEFGLAPEKIQPASKLGDDLGLDSIDLCDALVYMEKETGKAFPLEHFRTVSTVDDLVDRTTTILWGGHKN